MCWPIRDPSFGKFAVAQLNMPVDPTFPGMLPLNPERKTSKLVPPFRSFPFS
jgi:hypothetical protein